MGHHPRVIRTTTHRGFTLVEILVVLVIVGILIAMASALTRGVSAAQKRSLTATRMAGVDTAIVQFVMQQRRLPCPADGRIAGGMPNAGVGQWAGGVCALGGQQFGVVPWVTLGLSETDASDGWDRRLTYRAHPTLVLDAIMDMSQCDPAGGAEPTAAGACAAGCTAATVAACTTPLKYLSPTPPSPPAAPPKGFTINNVVGSVPPMMVAPTGAAYVVISHGETGGGAYLNSGTRTDSTTDDGLEERKNYADLALQAYYVDDSVTDIAGANHFDDTVSRPSVLSVISKAALGPRAH